MCGICGKIEYNNHHPQERRAVVQKMTDAIVHRGPDDEGTYDDGLVSLAMRRLAIIDLGGGDQPIWNEDKTICVFMNGEIYNHKELRTSLVAKGHIFTTHADTEVLLHAYEEYGRDFVLRLKGMFAFCLYDTRKEQLFFARDRFGEKPLYYRFYDGTFSFSSEMASLLEDRNIPRRLDIEALNYYVSSGYVPQPLTLVQQVYTLPPGHSLTLSKDGITIDQYFHIDYTNTGGITDMGEAAEYIEPYLEEAVQRQSISDVPIGAFLSGGIDSSTVCALLQRDSSRAIDTFTVRFEESSYDESAIAREVASMIGSNHHEITIPNQEFTEATFWEIIDHVGLPFPDSSAIPVSIISKEIRKHVKVAISGDGGDEIFAGYPVYGWWQKIQKITRVPSIFRSIGSSILNSSLIPLPSSKKRQIVRGLTASMHGERGISMGIHRMFFDDEMQSLFKNLTGVERQFFETVPNDFSDWSPLRKSMYHRAVHNLPNDMLIKVDRMSMAHSLEVRAPFLDPDLYQASLAVADDLLYDQGVGKRVLRSVMRHHLPDSVFDHPKSGFSIPLHKYQNEAFDQLIADLVNDKSPIYHLFNEEVLMGIMNKSRDRDDAYTTVYRTSHQRWTLLMLFGWVKRFDIEA